MPTPAFDWRTQIAPGIALLISVLTLLWSRIDKHRERKAAREAKLPRCEMLIEKIGADREFVLTVRNRADHPIRVESLDVQQGFMLLWDEEDHASKRRLNFDHIQLGPGEADEFSGKIIPSNGASKNPKTITFDVTIQMLDHDASTEIIKITRPIRG